MLGIENQVKRDTFPRFHSLLLRTNEQIQCQEKISKVTKLLRDVVPDSKSESLIEECTGLLKQMELTDTTLNDIKTQCEALQKEAGSTPAKTQLQTFIKWLQNMNHVQKIQSKVESTCNKLGEINAPKYEVVTSYLFSEFKKLSVAQGATSQESIEQLEQFMDELGTVIKHLKMFKDCCEVPLHCLKRLSEMEGVDASNHIRSFVERLKSEHRTGITELFGVAQRLTNRVEAEQTRLVGRTE